MKPKLPLKTCCENIVVIIYIISLSKKKTLFSYNNIFKIITLIYFNSLILAGTITKFQLSKWLSCKPFRQSTTCTNTIKTNKSNPIPLKKKKKKSNPTIRWLSCKPFWPLLLIQWSVTMLGSLKFTPNFKTYVIVFFSFLLFPTASASLSLSVSLPPLLTSIF